MYLTDKKAGLPRPPSDHEELEVLLESFSKQVEEIVNESETTMVRTYRGGPIYYVRRGNVHSIIYSTTSRLPKKSLSSY
jgi:hypothetical protein